jgi:hypothetical protein
VLTVWLPPRSSESQHRTDDLPIMSRALWPTELSRHSWPPRDRTAQYLRIRQAPSTSWVVASGEGESRTRKAEAQLLSGQIPSPIGLPLHGRIRRTRIPHRSAHSLAARPGTLAGSLSLTTSYRSADSNREPPDSGSGALQGPPGHWTQGRSTLGGSNTIAGFRVRRPAD